MDNIVKLIKKDIEKKKGKYVGRKYYKFKGQNKESFVNTYSNGEVHTIETDCKSDLYTNYFKLLVKQKINYLLAKEPELKVPSSLYELSVLTDMLESGLLHASLDSVAWLHFYVEDNRLEWVFVHDSEVIPFYDKYNKKIESVVRYFLSDKDTYTVETWTLDGVKVDKICKDKVVDSSTLSHYHEDIIYQGNIESSNDKNLPFIPFIPLFNNSDKESDLEGIQELIDMYNSINSGLVDNIDLFQEAIIKLRGYASDTNSINDLAKSIKKHKIVAVNDPEADIEYLKVEIPIEARKTLLDILKENIFKIGQGLDPDRLASESNLTNVVLKSRYSALDMKANGSQKQLVLFYGQFVNCLNAFYIQNIPKDITFNRSMIINESDKIKDCVKSMGMLDLQTILENHPFVKGNVKEVMARLEAEKEQKSKQDIEKQKQLLNISKPPNENI